MPYLPIADHGVIGDLYSVAVVGIDGNISWCCLPNFDSASVFGSILDDEKGGYFKISAAETVSQRQMYIPDTNILLTRSFTKDGLGQVEDFMPIARKGAEDKLHQIVRKITCVRGQIKYKIDCSPAPDYARGEVQIKLRQEGAIFETNSDTLFGLYSDIPISIAGKSVVGEVTLTEGDSVSFIFFSNLKNKCPSNPFSQIKCADQLFDETLKYWQDWISRCTYKGRWREMVFRSALTLKLLTYAPTGAMVAAATTSLPEQIGGERNWDYRYTWIRDASFTLYALMRIGYKEEAANFMHWLIARCEESTQHEGNPLNIMYDIHGNSDLKEESLTHLSGYLNSKPVRIGNGAYDQLQLDIYGELMDSVYLYNKYVSPVSYREWDNLRGIINWLSDNWNQADEGIWETRGGRQPFVFSRLMCWVAFDRASRMSAKHSLPGDRIKWETTRNTIYDEIMTKGWCEKLQSFRQHYNTEALDASNLIMPLVKFISPTDPRMLSTIDRTLERLTSDSLVYRYNHELTPDGLSGEEGTFSICTFWLVECLTRAGRLDEARLIFQKMLSYANHLGLYSEEIGIHGEMLGNFPQAFTHLSLISSAVNLDRALEGRKA